MVKKSYAGQVGIIGFDKEKLQWSWSSRMKYLTASPGTLHPQLLVAGV